MLRIAFTKSEKNVLRCDLTLSSVRYVHAHSAKVIKLPSGLVGRYEPHFSRSGMVEGAEMTDNRKRHAVYASACLVAALYSLLSCFPGNAAPVDFYFNGLMSSSPHQAGSSNGDSALRELNLYGDAILNHVPSNPVPFGEGNLRDHVFANTQYPATPPSLSSLGNNQQRIIFEDMDGADYGTAISRVSLPASVWLFGTGLVALVGLGSRGILSQKDL